MAGEKAVTLGEALGSLQFQASTPGLESRLATRNDKMKNLKIPKRFESADTGDFPDATLKAVGNTAKPQSYYITGPVGTGKTHLAVGILKEWAACGLSYLDARRTFYPDYDELGAAFIGAPELLGKVKASFDGKGKSSEWIIKSYQNARCLVLDDLGAEQKTEWSFSCLYRIISHRDGEMLPTIITSNLTLAQLEEWEPRIASRLAGMVVIALGGKDMRIGRRKRMEV